MKVLIVDDDRNIVESIQSIVPWEELGIEEVYEADQGQRALELIYEKKPDMVLSDVEMPVMDGHTAARNIRALEDPALAGVPIVALSANAFDEDRKMSAKSGMNAHMAKPIDVQRLLELVENVVGRAPEKENGKTGNVGGI